MRMESRIKNIRAARRWTLNRHCARAAAITLFAGQIVYSARAGSEPTAVTSTPVHLHPDNPHYLVFRGQPVVLVTSGEHYGAVLGNFTDRLLDGV